MRNPITGIGDFIRRYVRFCFPHATAADAFRDRFGDERLTYTPRKLWRLALKLKSKRIYAPRIVADHIMMQEDCCCRNADYGQRIARYAERVCALRQGCTPPRRQ